MRTETIQNLIETNLPECKAQVEGDGHHFEALVISPIFSGKTRIQKQQLVYASLKEYINNGSLHAISIKTFTPDEWQNFQTES